MHSNRASSAADGCITNKPAARPVGEGMGEGSVGINRESRANPTPVHVHVRAGCTVQPRPPVPPPLLARWFPPASSQHASSPLHLPLPALKYCGRSQQNSGQASRSASVCRPAVQSGAARTWCGGGSGGVAVSGGSLTTTPCCSGHPSSLERLQQSCAGSCNTLQHPAPRLPRSRAAGRRGGLWSAGGSCRHRGRSAWGWGGWWCVCGVGVGVWCVVGGGCGGVGGWCVCVCGGWVWVGGGGGGHEGATAASQRSGLCC